jgi:DNA-directed RNA polymerase subunit RPC12/RpoP
MPDYVCPECGKPLMQRAVVVEGTMMHYECHLKLKAKARMDIERRVDAVRAWARTREVSR